MPGIIVMQSLGRQVPISPAPPPPLTLFVPRQLIPSPSQTLLFTWLHLHTVSLWSVSPVAPRAPLHSPPSKGPAQKASLGLSNFFPRLPFPLTAFRSILFLSPFKVFQVLLSPLFSDFLSHGHPISKPPRNWQILRFPFIFFHLFLFPLLRGERLRDTRFFECSFSPIPTRSVFLRYSASFIFNDNLHRVVTLVSFPFFFFQFWFNCPAIYLFADSYQALSDAYETSPNPCFLPDLPLLDVKVSNSRPFARHRHTIYVFCRPFDILLTSSLQKRSDRD